MFIPDLHENLTGYDDYPMSATNAASKAINWKEKHGDQIKAGTKIGWTRARQLANREKISIDTIKRIKAFYDRMHSNFSVSSEHKDEPWKDNGYVSGLLWGFDGDGTNGFYKWLESRLEDITESYIGLNSRLTIPQIRLLKPIIDGARAVEVYTDGDNVYRIILEELFTGMSVSDVYNHYAGEKYKYVCNIFDCYSTLYKNKNWAVVVSELLHDIPFDVGDWTSGKTFAGMIFGCRNAEDLRNLLSRYNFSKDQILLINHSIMAFEELGFKPIDYGCHNIMYDKRTKNYKLIDFFD